MIKTLAPNQVFVFGSNEDGFHGAGAAGYAFRYSPEGPWRKDRQMAVAIESKSLTPPTKGKWAVFGQSQGFMEGTEGKSYAVMTVKKPGEKRSVTRREIYHQLADLWAFISEHPELEFLITPLGEGFAGYTTSEMAEVWAYVMQEHGSPDNIKFIGRGAKELLGV